MGESRDGWIFRMMLEAAAGQYNGWAAYLFGGAQIGILEDPIVVRLTPAKKVAVHIKEI